MATKTQTTAEQVADLFDNDGRLFQRTIQHPIYGEVQESLKDTCEEHNARRIMGEQHGRGDMVAYEFEDGSAIVVVGSAAWDIRHSDCTCGYCWAGEEPHCGDHC